MNVINDELVKVVEKYRDDWKAANKEVNRLIIEGVFPAYFRSGLEAIAQEAPMHEIYMRAQTLLSREELEGLGITADIERTCDAGLLIYKTYMNSMTNAVINEIRQ